MFMTKTNTSENQSDLVPLRSNLRRGSAVVTCGCRSFDSLPAVTLKNGVVVQLPPLTSTLLSESESGPP